MIHVIATIQLAPGRRADFLAEFKTLLPEVRAEVGCIEYGAATDMTTPIPSPPIREDVVTVIEKWESVDALRIHLAADHMESFRQKTQHLVESLEILVVRP